MLFLKHIQGIFIYILLLISQNTFADNHSNDINDKLFDLNIEILDLELRFEVGLNDSDLNIDTLSIYNQLLYYERLLNISSTNYYKNSNWNSTEEFLLNTKKKIKALQEKLKIEGDWGKVRLKLNPEEQFQKIDLNYIYGF